MKMKRLACVSLLMMAMGSGAAFAQTAEGLTPYAQIRAYTGWIQQSKEITGTDKDLDFVEKLGTTRVGVKGKYGTIDGVVELGIQNYSSSSSDLVSTRKAFAVWNVSDAFNMKIGQDEAPYTYYASSMTLDCSLNGFGTTWQKRDLQVKFTYAGAYLDFIAPQSPGAVRDSTGAAMGSTTSNNWDILFPKTAVGYEFVSADKSVSAGISAAYQASTFDGNKVVALDPIDGKRVDAGLATVHAGFSNGGFSAKINAGYGINSQIMGAIYGQSFASAVTSVKSSAPSTLAISALPELNAAGSSFKNTTTMEGFFELAYNFGVAEIRGAVGYAQAKNDNWKKTDAQMAYYVQSTIPLVEKRLNLIPEVAYFDYMKDKSGNKQGNELAAGMFFQILL